MLIKIIYRSLIIYGFVFLMLRFMGKREIGQLSLFDLVVIILIADISVMGIETFEIPFYYFLFPIATLALLQKIIAFALIKVPQARDLFDGKYSLIIDDGILNQKEMKKINYNIDDLVLQLRINNVRSISEVRYAVLETNGNISVFLHEDFAEYSSQLEVNITKGGPLNFTNPPQSVGRNSKPTAQDIYPFPLILSGVIKYENLDAVKQTERWLLKELRKKGYDSFEDILYANYEHGSLFIIETEKL